ncbi:MAG: hypothetical protein M3Q07_10625 [Pseudobdellovibrionaceae bacterium]|nr:hypothetical protein [Pseudobdellovibrionaceae bacterium]
MLTYDQIAEEARAYANFTTDQLEGLETEALHEQLSLRLVAVEELKASKKAIVGSSNDLMKRVSSDVLAINQEIRRRNANAARESRAYRSDLTLDALSEPVELEPIA